MAFLGVPRWPPVARTGRTIRAVCRISKVQGFGAVAAMEAHHLRLRPTTNADPARLDWNQWLLRAEGGLADTVRTKIERAEQLRKEAMAATGGKAPRKRRSDAVLAVEVVLSASPEFFRDDPAAAGTWSEEKLDAWSQASMAWLRERHGDNLVSVVLHLDEATPHIQAVFVPLTEDHRLSGKDVIGGPSELRALQDSYGDAVAPLGIQRGLEGSAATHTDVKAFYAVVNRALDPTPVEIVVETPPVLVGREQWAKTQTQRLEADVVPRLREAEARSGMAELERETLRKATGMVAGLRARTIASVAEVSASRRAQEAAEALQRAAEAREQAWRAQADQARAIPPSAVLEAAGWDLDPTDPHHWIGPGSRISVRGQQYYDHKRGRGGGGAIDLAMHLTGWGFRDTLAWLGEDMGQARVSAGLKAEVEAMESKPPEPFALPAADEGAWEAVRRYLVETRCLPARTVDLLRAGGKVIPLARRVLFTMTSLAGEALGAEARGIEGRKWRGLHARSSRNLGAFRVARGPIGRPVIAYLVESAIDAISLLHLAKPRPEHREVFVSTAGARSHVPWLREQLGDKGRLVVAYDADDVGGQAAAELLKQHPGVLRWRATGEDWNADLVEAERRKAAGPNPTESELGAGSEEPDAGSGHSFPR